eukprot:470187-Pleurochrysis_carterae.AAC.1
MDWCRVGRARHIDAHAPRMCARDTRTKRARRARSARDARPARVTSTRGIDWPTAQRVVFLGLGPQGGTLGGSPPVREFGRAASGRTR